MELNKLSKIKTRKAKRRGRGYGSCKGGHTVGFGQKGQGTRSGFKKLRGWVRESKIRSIPKLKGIGKRSAGRGYFKSKLKKIVFNVSDLEKGFNKGEEVTLKSLREKKLIRCRSKKIQIKVLGEGEIKKKLVVRGIDISRLAREKIESAGGKVVD